MAETRPAVFVGVDTHADVHVAVVIDSVGRVQGTLEIPTTTAGFAWLLAGGALYTAGIAFYATDHKVRHGHGVWHLFVIGGSACHFFTVLLHVA